MDIVAIVKNIPRNVQHQIDAIIGNSSNGGQFKQQGATGGNMLIN